MKDPHRYPVEPGWQLLFKDLGVSPMDVLKYARLPLDLLSRGSPSVTGHEYFRFWAGLEAMLDDRPTFPLELATLSTPESFSPPIFASFCSPDLLTAAKRIARYKPLVGPLRLNVQTRDDDVTIELAALPAHGPLPPSLIATELVWWVHVPRLATRERLVPRSVSTTTAIPAAEAYEDYFGVRLARGTRNRVTFSAADARKPFLSASDAMWSIFEPDLNRRMRDLDAEATTTDKVRACLTDILASGQYRVGDVATRLAVSPRTLQRNLRREGTTFQRVLDSLRHDLAHAYLERAELTTSQVAFLLGYDDPNSFFRAFRSWTGRTPQAVRASL